MGLVKNYSISTTNGINFGVTFDIPNNCNFAVSTTNSKYYITVCLSKGQSVPSAVFINCSASVNAIAGNTDVQFVQELNGITTNRPKILVENTAVSS